MKIFLLASAFLLCLNLNAQDKLQKIANEIKAEGTELYKSEMASWYGTDLFLEKFAQKRENIGGYFSYVVNNIPKCIFYSKGDTAHVIGTIIFDTAYNTRTATVDGTDREFTATEREYFSIRSKALERVKNDTLFERYKNTDLNLIPIIKDGEKKVYILTGPQQNGVVVFGNDYLITFNKKNEIISEKRLHKNILFIHTDQKEADSIKVTGSMHTHLPETGEFITPTDVCTLMLYEKYTPWETHIVVSEQYMSIWNCKNNTLIIVTKDAMNKIYNDKH